MRISKQQPWQSRAAVRLHLDRKPTGKTNRAYRAAAAVAWVVLWFLAANSTTAQAQQFRIETQIYVNDSSQPVSSNTTLFSDGMVFDFQTQGTQIHEATVLAPKQHQIILLDRIRQVKLVLDEVRLIKMADALRRETSQNQAASFLVNDKFKEELFVDAGRAQVTSPLIKYSIVGKRPNDLKVFPAYSQFIEYFTRLKVSDPHAFPPFPRMRLNETINKLGWIPSEITVRLEPNPMIKDGMQAVSKHTFVDQLSDTDLESIAKAKSEWLNFRAISLADYRGLATKKRLFERSATKDRQIK